MSLCFLFLMRDRRGWRPPPHSTWAAAVGVQFRVKPKQSKWENSSQCPVLEIRRSNRGFYVQQGYTVCSAPYSISGFSLPGPDCASHGQRLYVCMLSIPFSSTPYLWNALKGFLPNWHQRLLMLRLKLFLFLFWCLVLACQIWPMFCRNTSGRNWSSLQHISKFVYFHHWCNCDTASSS